MPVNTLIGVKLLNLDHVAIAVSDLDAAIDDYRDRYRVEPLYRETVEAEGIEQAMIPIGASFVQLLQPLGSETPVGRFLSKRGEGLHHVAYVVTSIDDAVAHLSATDAELVAPEPSIGVRGHRSVFVRPSDVGGTLVELLELSDG